MPGTERPREESISLKVGPGALLEYYPDEAIVFANSRVERRTVIVTRSHGAFVRHRHGRPPAESIMAPARLSCSNRCAPSFEIQVDRQTVLLDRLIAEDAEEIEALQRLWGGASHLATVVAVGDDLPSELERRLEVAMQECKISASGAPGRAIL